LLIDIGDITQQHSEILGSSYYYYRSRS